MDLLSDVLTHLHLKGTLYFRTSFASPWGVKVPPFQSVARFHYAHRGRCLVRITSDTDPVRLEQGDLMIISRGAGHVLYSEPSCELDALDLDTIVEQSDFSGKGTLVWGNHGDTHETELICGHFAFDEKAHHPLISELPEYMHIRNYGDVSGPWMEHTLKVIGSEAGNDQMGSELISLKLSEIIFAQAIRSYLSTSSNLKPGLKGFVDLRVARALKAVHEDPGTDWSLETLASIAGMSRTAFINTFSELMSVTPIAYITQWRIQLAREQLETSNRPIIDIAESIGYNSEAAFGRVFKKHFDLAPATYRRQIQQQKTYMQ